VVVVDAQVLPVSLALQVVAEEITDKAVVLAFPVRDRTVLLVALEQTMQAVAEVVVKRTQVKLLGHRLLSGVALVV
jgi:hypothetical protein